MYLLGKANPKLAMGLVFAGYCNYKTLSRLEIESLLVLSAVRLSISILNGAYAISKDPDNEYLKIHSVPARKALENIWKWYKENKSNCYNFFNDIQVSVKENPFNETTNSVPIVINRVNELVNIY